MIVAPATPHEELNSVIVRGTGVGTGVLVQPTRNRKVIRPITNNFLIVIPPPIDEQINLFKIKNS
jgi:hypothetical protein